MSDTQDTYTEHQSALQDVIAKISDEHLITHYVVVAAGITDQGDAFTTTITSPGLPLWQKHGLLSYEATATQAQPEWTTYDDEDEDDD